MALQRKLVVELIGTFFLVFTIGMAVDSGSPLAPLAIGAALMVMIFAGGHVSGGHYNPAVSLAVYLRGKMDQQELLPYMAAQVGGAILAALAVIVLGADADTAIDPAAGKALLSEFLFTFALAWVVLNVATARGTQDNSFYGLAIGFTVLTGAVAVGGVSGGAFNPAVAVGATIAGLFDAKDIWIYLIADLAGGAAAAYTFLYTQPAEKAAGDRRAAEPDEA